MVLAAGAMILIIGMAALAVDVGSLYATRRNMQTAADAAAVAGANALEATCGTNSGCTCESQSSCGSAGQNLATFNGFANGGANSTTVTVASPNPAPANPANGVFVQATVSQAVPTYFLGALGYSTMNVSTTAIAGYAPTPNCIYIGDTSGSGTLTASGGSGIVADCGLLVESTDSKGMVVSGGSTIAASSVGLVASSAQGISASSVTCGGSTANCPQVGVSSSPDPLAYLDAEEPTPGTCAAGTSASKGYKQSTTPATIGPGTYCDGITVPGGDVLNLNPGLYILTGSGGLNVSGGAKINGTGVTFYNTGTGQITISGGKTVATLSAPVDSSAGGIPSVLFFQDPANTAKATISGGSTDSLQGALYFPSTQMLTFSGGTSTNPQDVVLDAWEVTISGGSAFLSAPGASLGGGPPITTSRLYQ
jgi:Putative Flp pilus-assembly TadE/G-like